MKLVLLAIILTGTFITACVSVKLNTGSAEKSTVVHFIEPSRPFKQWKSSASDDGWQSQKTGNTIAYLSECRKEQSLPSLETLEREAVNPLTGTKAISREDMTFNGRGAVSSVYEGTVDGVPVRLALLVFNKDGCSYTLTYGGEASVFEHERRAFEQFKANFRTD